MDPSKEKSLAEIRRSDLLCRVAEAAQQSLQEENKVLKAEVSRMRDEISQLNAAASMANGDWSSTYSVFSEDLSTKGFNNLIALSESGMDKPVGFDAVGFDAAVPKKLQQVSSPDYLLVSSLDQSKLGGGLRSTVLSADYVYPRNDNPLSLTPLMQIQEFKIGSPELINRSGHSAPAKSALKSNHPLRAALRNLISQQKGQSNLSSVSLSALVSIPAEQVRKAKMSDGDQKAAYMTHTDSSVLKKKDVSEAAQIAGMKTYSGWRG